MDLRALILTEVSTGDLGHPFTPILDEIGIQHKPRSTLLELIKSQPRRDMPGRARRSWKEGKPLPPKKMRFKERPSKSKWGRRAPSRGLILKSHLQPRPPPQFSAR